MEGLLRKLMIWICSLFYKLIPTIYDVFYKLANHRFFEDDTIERLSSNIYVLVSVVMLFAFSANLIAAIVNPDLLNDKKKGVGALFKRSIIGLMLMVLIPFLFDKAYDIQKEVMDKNLIEKVLVGISYDESSNAGGNGGQVIAGTLISSVLYPVKDDIEISEDIAEIYADMVVNDIDNINKIAKHINIAPVNSDEEYAFEFESLVALIAGFACCYILLLFAFDMAVRTVKLAFLELTAPISTVAYIAAGDDMLKKWSGEVFKTFLDVFMRIACMAFYIFIIANLDQFLYRVSGGWFVKVLLIVGVLIFVKQLPDFVNKIFGANIKSRGGIGGRLGEMAGVGAIAKKGWETISKGLKTVGLTTAGVGVAVGTLGLGAPALGIGLIGAHRAWNKGIFGQRAGKDTQTGKALRMVGSSTSAFLKSGNPLSGISAATKAYNESDWGKEKLAEKQYVKASKAGERFNEKLGLDKDGKVEDGIVSRNMIKRALNNEISMDSKQKAVTESLLQANHTKAILDKISANKNNISDKFTELANNTTNVELKHKLEDINSKFNGGKLSSVELESQIRNLVQSGQISSGAARNIISNLDGINNILEHESDLKKVLVNENGKLAVLKIKAESEEAERKAKDAKSDYDKVYEASTSNAKDKMLGYVSKSERIDNKYIKDISASKLDEKGNIKNKHGGSSRYAQDEIYNRNLDDVESVSPPQTEPLDLDDDIWDEISDVQTQINEDRINNAYNNQTIDNTNERGTYEPEKNNKDNTNDNNYDDIYSQYYDDNENE